MDELSEVYDLPPGDSLHIVVADLGFGLQSISHVDAQAATEHALELERNGIPYNVMHFAAAHSEGATLEIVESK